MKAIFLVCALVVAVYARPDEEHYTDKYDEVDLKELMENGRLYKSYLNCLLDEGKCTADAQELKAHMTDAMETECSKCTKKQKDGTRFVISHLINKKPEDWKKLTAKYDPKGKYVSKYEQELKTIS